PFAVEATAVRGLETRDFSSNASNGLAGRLGHGCAEAAGLGEIARCRGAARCGGPPCRSGWDPLHPGGVGPPQALGCRLFLVPGLVCTTMGTCLSAHPKI